MEEKEVSKVIVCSSETYNDYIKDEQFELIPVESEMNGDIVDRYFKNKDTGEITKLWVNVNNERYIHHDKTEYSEDYDCDKWFNNPQLERIHSIWSWRTCSACGEDYSVDDAHYFRNKVTGEVTMVWTNTYCSQVMCDHCDY